MSSSTMCEKSSPPSQTVSRHISFEDEDESVRIAVSALGDMRNGARASGSNTSSALYASSPSLPADITSPDFVARVSNFPLFNSALRAYEHGKASSRVVKYGAEMMESSVKTISRPVIDRLPVDVNQLDEFACRQLDKLGRYHRPSGADLERMQVDETSQEKIIREGQTSLDYFSSRLAHEGTDPQSSSSPSSHPPTPNDNKSPVSPNQITEPPEFQGQQAVVQRSRWQAVLLEAGGISAAVSEESMRRLKYCLQWLQYATLHIDAQILILRDFITSLQPSGTSSGTDSLISPTHMRTLTDVRRDVVQTIRQVVDVVSKYAGSALPEPARSRVRSFILHLPQRWASASINPAPGMADGAPGACSAVGAATGGAGSGRRGRTTRHKERKAGGPDRSRAGTPVSSRASSPLASARAGFGMSQRPTTGAATQAAQHVLALATESLDMMRGVTGVVKDSLDRADAWVERLRVVGLQRQQSRDDPEPFDPTSSSFTQHRRQNSIPGLSSTPSTPFSSIPSTPVASSSVPVTPAAYSDALGMGLRLGEVSARTSLSELQLDGETVCDAPRIVPKDLNEGEQGRRKPDRIWERQSPDNTTPSRDGMVVDDG
ncbi:transcription factor Opi1-domain-containing protein [Suillus paluster]|uniref:transcription factor Opi1-domain-containing protein n=1 Tax=Suillus paluster TaxID=48578 RepID=UPI001B86B94D|nr:transcription factor Opi1-domain-containing protein [Suillus paluster]KAG1734457.1 transcription factor Opi1-domain-containing protein [Suillus paluster]